MIKLKPTTTWLEDKPQIKIEVQGPQVNLQLSNHNTHGINFCLSLQFQWLIYFFLCGKFLLLWVRTLPSTKGPWASNTLNPQRYWISMDPWMTEKHRETWMHWHGSSSSKHRYVFSAAGADILLRVTIVIKPTAYVMYQDHSFMLGFVMWYLTCNRSLCIHCIIP